MTALGLYAAGGLASADRAVSAFQERTQAAIVASRDALSDFARMRATDAQRHSTPEADATEHFGEKLGTLREALSGHLASAADRAISVRASQAALHAQEAVRDWHEAAGDGALRGALDADLGRLADVADAQFDRLNATTAIDGIRERRALADRLAREVWLVLAVAASAILVALLAACLGIRRTNGRWHRAAAAADAIADGDHDHPLPKSGPGLYGSVLRAIERLRARLVEARTRESTLRNSPGNRLAEALRAASEGVMLVDKDGTVVFANEAAGALSADVATLRSGISGEGADRGIDIRTPDGRILRARRSATAAGEVVVVSGDVGAEREREAAAAATSASLQAALDHMSQGLCLYDADGRLLVVNRRYSEIYRLAPDTIRCGMSAEEVLSLCLAAGNHPDRALAELLAEAGRFAHALEPGSCLQELSDGRVVAIVMRHTEEGGTVATYEDVTERWHAESRIARMARHDALTKLPNRVLFGERIEGAITQACRESGFAVLCLDLDNFKQVNDTLGHSVGDELLRAVAHRLSSCVREVDTVARLGGDEFAIVQSGVEQSEDAAILAARIIEVVSAPYELSEHAVTIGVSIGIAIAPRDGMTAERILKNADVALYRAKADGRGVFRFFEAEMDARLQARRSLEIDLRAAVAAEAFDLHFQPIYDLRQNSICGFEALLRWMHPTRGPVSPVEFIPLAEEVGLIVPLGEWVLKRACAEAAHWPDDLKVAVNVSPAQFQSAQLIDVVRSALSASGLSADRLELEITESVLLVNGSATLTILHALKSVGVRIAMDDFGTGYSSLSYLRSFPFDKMKIDRSFIRDLAIENGSGFIVRAVISLGCGLGMTMTAEGVETEEQLARLRAEGCHEAQGYLFSRPIPVAQVPALIETWNRPTGAARAA